MHHNGETVVTPWGYYELDSPLINQEGRTEWAVYLDIVELALKIQQSVVDAPGPLNERELARFAEIKAIPADRPRRKLVKAAYDLVGFSQLAGEYINGYAKARDLAFQPTEHGYYAIVPDHDCVSDPDEPCPHDPDPKSTYGLTDEQLEALRGGADWSAVKEMA